MSSDFCGCSYVQVSSKGANFTKHYLPLVDVSVHSTILSTVSRTVLTQKYTNPTKALVEKCSYTFPLYDGVSVVKFECRIGSQTLRGVVHAKAKAKAIYDEAVSKGETAGLLEQAVEASDVFSTRLGNIPAGETALVELTYVGELKHDAETDGVRLTIPTRVAPRYGPYAAPPASISETESVKPEGMRITVDVNMPGGTFIQGLQSPSHPIAMSLGVLSTNIDIDPVSNKASATLSQGSTILERDFVLIVQAKEVSTPKAFLETHPTIANHRALMATLVPKFTLPSSKPEIVLLIDRSGSMIPNVTTLKSAVTVFLKSMPAGVTFNLCSFGTNFSFLWPKSKICTKDTMAQALGHVPELNADMSGNEEYKAFEAVFKRRHGDVPLDIIFFTDGGVWNPEVLLEYIHGEVVRSNGGVRVITLGIGDGVSHYMAEGLSRAGNGFTQMVQNGERFDNKVVRMLRGALSPHVWDYTLEVKYKDDDDFELIEEVTEGLKVLLSNTPNQAPPKMQAKTRAQKAKILLFNPASDPDEAISASDDAAQISDLPDIFYPKLLQAPHKIPALFPFSRTTVYLLMSPSTIQKNPTSVILHGTSPQGPLELEISIESLPSPSTIIHQLAARKAVQELEEGRGWLYSAQDQDGILIKDHFSSRMDSLIEREAVRLGEQFQVANRWCSFAAVKHSDQLAPDPPFAYPHFPHPDSLNQHFSLDFSAVESSDVLNAFDFDAFLAPGASEEFEGFMFRRVAAPSSVSRGRGTTKKAAGKVAQRMQLASIAPRKSIGTPKQPPAKKARLVSASAIGAEAEAEEHVRDSGFSASPQVMSDSDKVFALISMQDFDGWWEASKRLAKIVGIKQKMLEMPEKDIKERSKGNKKKEQSMLWATMVVVAFMEEKMHRSKDIWELVVEKARVWIGTQQGFHLEALMAEAFEVVRSTRDV